jgi:hypothetical protein
MSLGKMSLNKILLHKLIFSSISLGKMLFCKMILDKRSRSQTSDVRARELWSLEATFDLTKIINCYQLVSSKGLQEPVR